MLPANKLPNLRRRVNRARTSEVTCPASRHVHDMAEQLLSLGRPTMIGFEPEDCAASMLAVLESLWKLRAELKRLKGE